MTPFRFLAAALAAFALSTPLAALADPAEAKKALEARLGGSGVESVNPTPFQGIYEAVVMGPRGPMIIYTDDKAQFMFVGGGLLDIRSEPYKDLTTAAQAKMNAGALKDSLHMAVKRVRGSGKRTLITFEDPNCGYCKQLQNELMKLNDVTIYTFLWPFLAESSLTKSQAVWCAKDRGQKFEAVMLRNDPATPAAGCEYPHAEQVARMAQRLGLNGTPAIFLADGTEFRGARSAAAIDQALGAN